MGGGRTILHVHLNCRPIRCLAHPKVEILSILPCLEEDHIVAVIKFGELVQLVELRFRVELRIFPAMG
jgi:hypothetical protein